MPMSTLTLEALQAAVKNAAAFRCRATLQPAGGPGDKVFPPTYAGAVYAIEQRRLPGREEPVTCVLLDSVQSQANRMEEALQEAVDRGALKLPVVVVDFHEADLLNPIDRVTSLQAPHRIADAILRDSLLADKAFRHSEAGQALDQASIQNATPLYELCPTALLFGLWDSTGPKGGLGAKFARALVSEIIGIDAAFGTKTSSRIDPLQILLKAGPLYHAEAKDGVAWTLDPAKARKEKGKPATMGKDGKPSEANHGNVTPSLSETDKVSGQPLAGGVTIAAAEQMTVLSLPALRRLHFPLLGQTRQAAPEQQARDAAAQTVLAALALAGASLAAEKGLDLRSRCLLWPEQELCWELLGKPGTAPVAFALNADQAIDLLQKAVEAAKTVGLSWREEPLVLKPSPQLVALVRKSQELAVAQGAESDEGEN